MEEDFYTPSLMASLLASGTQAPLSYIEQMYDLPAATSDEGALPAAASPVDLGDWSLENFQKQFMQGDPAKADAAAKWLAAQAAQGKEYVYDPNQKDLAYQMQMNSAVPLMSSFGGPSYANFDPNNPAASMGEVFRFDIDKNKGTAPVVLGEGQNYVLTDAKGEKVLGRASTAEEMRALMDAANAQKYGWNLYQGNEQGGYTKGGELFGESDPRVGGVLGALVQYGLPIGLSLIPGVGWAGSAALTGAGSTAGKLISGYDFDDALKSGLITAGTAGLLKAPILEGGGSLSGALSNAVGIGNAPTSAFDSAFDADYASWLASGADVAAPAFSGAVGGAGGTLGGSFAGTDAGGNFIQVIGSTAGSRIPASVLSGALSAAAAAPGLINYGDQVWGEQPSQGGEANKSYYDPVANEIVVPSGTTSFPIDPNSILAGFLGSFYPPLTSVNIPPLADTQLPELPPEEIPEGTGEDIVVNAPTGGTVLPPIPFPIANVQLPAPPLNSVTIPPGAGTTLPPTNNTPSLLDQIIKYVTIGSGVADLLGGQGGTRQPTTTPNYGSLLGGVPNFGRGAFTPFTGDYEKYAFGPEWNFFGGAPASTPTNG